MYLRFSRAPMLPAEADSPSLVEGARTRGRPLRRWALAAMVTLESVTPAASLPRVLPVQGQMISRSSSFWGPMGSAPLTVAMTRWSQMRSTSRIRSWAAPKRVSVAATVSDTMGTTRAKRAFTCSRASTALAWVQKDPHRANPTVLSIKAFSFPPAGVSTPAPGAYYRWRSGWPPRR